MGFESGGNVNYGAEIFAHSRNLRISAASLLRPELAGRDGANLAVEIEFTKDVHPELSCESSVLNYVEGMSRPFSEWGDLVIMRFVSEAIGRPIVVFDIQRFTQYEDLRTHTSTYLYFPPKTLPVVIAVGNEHFYPMVAPMIPESPLRSVRREQPEPSTLRRIFPCTPFSDKVCTIVPRFLPQVEPKSDAPLDPEINNPERIDLDASCFVMLIEDLFEVFGTMVRPANRKVSINDLPEFADGMLVLSDPVVVKIFAGSNQEERMEFKSKMISILRS